MRYFKDSKGQFFGVDVGQEKIIKPDWKPATLAEINAANAPTPQQLRQGRIEELKQFLRDSDYKVMPDYDKPNEAIKAQRQAWREEIRKLGG
jgi:FtsZ-binding cell division protein ZapB